jgi:hypothetical protein
MGTGIIAPRLGRFTPGERAPGTHWIGGESIWHTYVNVKLSLSLNQTDQKRYADHQLTNAVTRHLKTLFPPRMEAF